MSRPYLSPHFGSKHGSKDFYSAVEGGDSLPTSTKQASKSALTETKAKLIPGIFQARTDYTQHYLVKAGKSTKFWDLDHAK